MRVFASCAFAAAVSIAVHTGASAQQPSACGAMAVAPSLQQPPRPPKAVVTVGNAAVIVGDAGARRAVVACQPDAAGIFQETRRWPLSSDFSVTHVEVQGGTLHLRATDGRTTDVEVGRPGAESTTRRAASPPAGGYAHEVRMDGDAIVLAVRGLSGSAESAGTPLVARISPVAPNARIVSRQVIGVDLASRSTTVLWDEVGASAWSFVGRFDSAGQLVAGARLPIEHLESAPENVAGMLPDGRVFYLEVKGNRAEVKLLPMSASFVLDVSNRAIRRVIEREIEDAKARRGGQRRAATPLSSESVAASPDADFRAKVRATTGDRPSTAEAPAPMVARAEVEACAVAFSTHVWTLAPAAYSRPNVANECEPQSRFWRRPFYLNGQVGKQIVGVPYCWGCSDSIAKFDANVTQGSKLAGHSCTCRSGHYCIRQDVTGVDCSGFISQCWKSGYYTTSSMHEIADEIDLSDIKPGDAFNKPGSHIRLFMSTVEGPNGTRYRVIEAANGEGRIGRVVEQTYSVRELRSYSPVRYSRIRD